MSKYKSCVSSEYVWASRCLAISSVLVRHAVPSQVRQLFWLRQKREENSDSKLKIKVLFLMRAQVWLDTMCICVVNMPNTDKQLAGCLRLSHRCKPHTAALLTDLGVNTCTVTTTPSDTSRLIQGLNLSWNLQTARGARGLLKPCKKKYIKKNAS